uniref:Peroxisomal membrane protein PMP22 n=1 Tax=Quercus lobata TaxID=97700 RepID=A0A7N2LSC5_QUELO
MAKKGLLNQYLLQLQHHPLRTKAITAGVLSGISDLVSQKLTGIQKIQLRRLVLKVVKLFVNSIYSKITYVVNSIEDSYIV